MECKSGCHEKNLQQFNGHLTGKIVISQEKFQQFNDYLQHWTETETNSDSQVESLIKVA